MFEKTFKIALDCLLGCALTGAALADEATAQEGNVLGGVHGSVGTVVKDGYLANGYLYADEWVLQSLGLVTFHDFCFSVWNSIGLEDSHCAGSYASETDYELDYNWTVGDFDFMAGIASFVYPDTDDAFDDWVAKATIGYNGWWLRPEINARIGLEGQQGDYSQFILSKVFGLADNLSLRAYGIVAYGTKVLSCASRMRLLRPCRCGARRPSDLFAELLGLGLRRLPFRRTHRRRTPRCG